MQVIIFFLDVNLHKLFTLKVVFIHFVTKHILFLNAITSAMSSISILNIQVFIWQKFIQCKDNSNFYRLYGHKPHIMPTVQITNWNCAG